MTLTVNPIPPDQAPSGTARMEAIPFATDPTISQRLVLELNLPRGGAVNIQELDRRYVLKPRDETDLTIGSITTLRNLSVGGNADILGNVTIAGNLGLAGDVSARRIMAQGQVVADWLAVGEPQDNKNFWAFINPDDGPDLALGTVEPPNLSRLTLTVMEFERATGRVQITKDLRIGGNLRVEGAKFFVQRHPNDPTKEITFAALEGPEVGVYIRGEAELKEGQAVVELPEEFTLVTAAKGLTVQLTPVGQWLQLYVVELSPQRLVVREAQGKDGQFFYLIQGLRKGYEGFQAIQRREGPEAAKGLPEDSSPPEVK